MYLSHYNIKENPFNISPDTRFLWMSEEDIVQTAVAEDELYKFPGVLAAGQHDHPGGQVVVKRTRHLGQLADELPVEGVEVLVPVEGDQGDRSVPFHRDIGLRHLSLPPQVESRSLPEP